MEPKNETKPIPIGWMLETEVQLDGSKTSFYYCPESGQHFFSYAELIRYVKYAKRERIGIYGPAYNSLDRNRNMENDSSVIQESYYSSTDDESSDSDSSTSSGSTDKKDQDYMSESKCSVSVDSEYCDTKLEVTQIPKKQTT